MTPYIVIIGALVQIVGYYPYLKETLRGESKPNRMSWLMWSVAPIIGTAAALSDGVRWAVLPVFMAGLGPLVVVLASFLNKESYWKLERFDYVCGAFSVIALVVWQTTTHPSIAVLFAVLSDGAAGVPTLLKAWRYPETENAWPFVTSVLGASTSFVAIKSWSVSAYAFPVYLVLDNVLTTCVIFRKRLVSPAGHRGKVADRARG